MQPRVGLGRGGGDAAQDWTAWLLAKPFGLWLVGLIGLGVMGGGVAFLVKAAMWPVGFWLPTTYAAASAPAARPNGSGGRPEAPRIVDFGASASAFKLDRTIEDAPLAASIAKAKAGRVAELAVQEAVQMHGGVGMTDAFDVGLFMKRVRVLNELLGDVGFHAEQLARRQGF